MSLTGNNSNSGTSGRSSIFETFHTPNFGDETFEVQPVKVRSRLAQQEPADTLSGSRSTENPSSAHHPSTDGPQRQEAMAAEEEEEEEEYALEEDEDVSPSENALTTLWMSCSPGRDLTDDEVDEEWGESTSQEMDEMNEEQELDDEGKSSEDDDEDEDDGLPLSKLARKHSIEREPIHPNARRHPKISRKTKTVTDKKAGSKKQIPANSKKKKKLKLVKRSAYSFFYSDTQNAIKSQNPAATFGEISKIVASMWDHLGSDLKENYSRRADEFNAQHKDEILLAARSKPKKSKKSSKSKHRTLDSETPSESLDSLEGRAFKGDNESKDDSSDNVDASSSSFGDSSRSKLRKEDRPPDKEAKTKHLCNYTKCQNPAVDDPRWEYNYCSPQCVISHCKDVFKAWVANRKSAYCET